MLLKENACHLEAGGFPLDGKARLAALRRCRLLDSEPEEAFDRVTRLAARLLDAPVALVSLVEPHRQFFKSAVGLSEPWASRRETPLSHSFCRHVVAQGAPLAIEDATEHPLVRDDPGRHALGVVAYLGVPLRAPTGEVFGSLCVIDDVPRAWDEEDERALEDLAAVLTSEMERRTSVRRLEEETQAHIATRSVTHTALDTLDDIFFVLDPQGRVVRWNRKAREVTGYTDLEFEALSIQTFFAEKDRERVGDALFEVWRRGQARVEAGLVTRDGREIPYEFTGALMKDERGEPTGVCGIGRNIAEQQEAARALRASEARFRFFVEATAHVVWRADASGAVVELGDAWSTFTGQTPEEIAGWGWTEALHPEDVPRLLKEWPAHIASRVPYTTDYRVRRHDGVYHWFVARAVPIFDEHSDFTGWVGTCQNIEEQRRVEQALQASEERLRLALEAVQMGTWDYDLRTGIVARSARTLALLGVTEETFDGPPSQPYFLLVEEDRARVGAAMEAAVQEAGAGDGLNVEFRLRRPDGDMRTLRSIGRVYLDDEGEPLRMTGVILDVTDEKAHEAALIEAKDQAEAARAEAEAAARTKNALLSNMSHEIRTPLTSVIGFADILAQEVPEEHREFAQLIAQGGRRLMDTLNSVLDLAQIEAGRHRLDLVEADLRETVSEAADLLRPRAAAKGLAFEVVLPEVPALARTDGGALGRVVTNLISNAVKFTDTGTVTVFVDADGEGVEICVADTGVGIAEAFIPHLFEEFHQESEGEARHFEGSGLGLAITKRLVEMLDGEIAVASEKGVGSAFTVRFAAASCPSRPTAPSAPFESGAARHPASATTSAMDTCST